MTKYLFEDNVELTCVSIEAALGLGKGDITHLTIYPSGAVEIETKLSLSVGNHDKLKQLLESKGLGRGKKPRGV